MGLITASLGLLLSALFLGVSSLFSDTMGPYELFTDEIYNCHDVMGTGFHFEIHPFFYKENGIRKLSFAVNFTVTLNKEEFENMTTVVVFYMRKNNNFLYTYKYENILCPTIFEYMKDPYDELLDSMGLEKDACAMKPGFHMSKSWMPNLKIPVQTMEYGTYKMVMDWFLGEVKITCIQALIFIKPKS